MLHAKPIRWHTAPRTQKEEHQLACATLSLQLSEKNAFTLSSQTVCVNHKSRSGVAAVAVVLY